MIAETTQIAGGLSGRPGLPCSGQVAETCSEPWKETSMLDVGEDHVRLVHRAPLLGWSTRDEGSAGGGVASADEPEPDGEETGVADDGLETFLRVRSRLFGIAYRVLGGSAEAEDVVQDAWLRWQSTDRSVVLDAPAFLATMTTRLAINATRSARSRHETYLGPWVPEPADASAEPALATERSEALGLAVFLLLEKLSPTERAAYVLCHAFDYSFAQIADMLQVSEANARQLASRARKRLAAERRRQVRPTAQRHLLETFLVAARSGELTALEELFVADADAATSRREPCVHSMVGRRQAPRRLDPADGLESSRSPREGALAEAAQIVDLAS